MVIQDFDTDFTDDSSDEEVLVLLTDSEDDSDSPEELPAFLHGNFVKFPPVCNFDPQSPFPVNCLNILLTLTLSLYYQKAKLCANSTVFTCACIFNLFKLCHVSFSVFVLWGVGR